MTPMELIALTALLGVPYALAVWAVIQHYRENRKT